jgi:hypothetical protein
MNDRETLRRYRQAMQQYQQWLCEFPMIVHALKSLEAEAEGAGLNAGTPVADEFCTISGTREQLRKLERAVLSASASDKKDSELLDWCIQNNRILTQLPTFHRGNGNLVGYETAGNRASIEAAIAANAGKDKDGG